MGIDAALKTGAQNRSEAVPLFSFEGARPGPTLCVIGDSADLRDVLQDLRGKGDAARLSGRLEFFDGSFDGLRWRDHIVLPSCARLPSTHSPAGPAPMDGYEALIECACARGMFPAPPDGFYAQRHMTSPPAARKTGTGWKLRKW